MGRSLGTSVFLRPFLSKRGGAWCGLSNTVFITWEIETTKEEKPHVEPSFSS